MVCVPRFKVFTVATKLLSVIEYLAAILVRVSPETTVYTRLGVGLAVVGDGDAVGLGAVVGLGEALGAGVALALESTATCPLTICPTSALAGMRNRCFG